MYKLVDLQINKQVLPLFSFLKDNPTRTLTKGKHVIMTYFELLDSSLINFSYKGITVTIQDTDSLDNYLMDGWQITRNYEIATVKKELLAVLFDLEQECLNRARAGNTVAINGVVYNWIAYGLSTIEDVISFVKMFYLNGYSYEQITQLYSALTKSNRLNVYFLNVINSIFRKDLDERIFKTA